MHGNTLWLQSDRNHLTFCLDHDRWNGRSYLHHLEGDLTSIGQKRRPKISSKRPLLHFRELPYYDIWYDTLRGKAASATGAISIGAERQNRWWTLTSSYVVILCVSLSGRSKPIQLLLYWFIWRAIIHQVSSVHCHYNFGVRNQNTKCNERLKWWARQPEY